METIRTLVVDDEKPARRRLLEQLEKEPDIEVVGIGRDGPEAVKLIRDRNPDLLFLDIQMPRLDGFGVLRSLGPGHLPVTIFVTAYDKYAIRAFEAHALDYLLKPFSDERFDAALRRARHYIRTHRASELGQRLARLLTDQTTGDAARVREPASGNVEPPSSHDRPARAAPRPETVRPGASLGRGQHGPHPGTRATQPR